MSEIPLEVRQEIDDFRQRLEAYQAGSFSAQAFKPIRLRLGVYGLRGIKDKQMIRVRVPSGRLTKEQLLCLAEVAQRFAGGHLHITTRQDIQFYNVPIHQTADFMERLAEVGLTTREASGNSVRNVTACPAAGLCAEELFDVSPHANAVTSHFLRNPLSQALPRKFKMSFSGCQRDCAKALIHDVGVLAIEQDKCLGFRLYVGGGLGPIPKAGHLFEAFTAAEHLLPTIEAIIRVFNEQGQRKDPHRARLKFLIERIGFDAFRRMVLELREKLNTFPGRFVALPAEPKKPMTSRTHFFPEEGSALCHAWLKTNVHCQRHPEFVIVTIRCLLGDITASQLRGVASLVDKYGCNLAVTTQDQNLCIPWVPLEKLPQLYTELSLIDLGQAYAQRIQDITCCPGADTCQIGITSSRGLAQALTRLLEQPIFQTEDLKALRIKVSGCPNSCGQHSVADIGFSGAARTIGGRMVPHYQLLVGGAVGEEKIHFGQPVAKIPAKRVPEALERLLQLYRRQRCEGETFRVFIQRLGIPALQQALHDLTILQPNAEEESLFRDWGKSVPFVLSVGQGECAS
ncbi:MAG: nitrite/sulfite reductase [Candidatus Omnitrophica bacterium]|nr:nitrite/sulfite reductase [Candidatus Omnitrophota bacterium]